MADIQRISPEQAKKLMDEEGYVYLDVRSEPEYAAGHPSGAHNVPLLHAAAGGMKQNPDFLDVVRALYPTDAKIIVGCRSGQRSMRAAEAMVSAGYTGVVEQRAGFEGPRDAFGALTERGWGPAGLPVETSTPGASYAELRQKAGR
ncbi:rhodanese-like domain-containing protein [Sorangium cellulosum]|uniref:Rhodanese-like domain-containing protein n=1 Tax=Sorangium cellulosum TaxID=56 RepID=A0A2L0EJ43_SORCE|nr:rhodanese-like domain-containing protein [Sorangium cellulosum]AUX39315.1 rhodanese-like domain-containing protein [Sorangium cellulosum]